MDHTKQGESMFSFVRSLFYKFSLVGQLKKDEMNVVYIPTGKLPKNKVEEYMNNLSEKIKSMGYKVILIAYPEL